MGKVRKLGNVCDFKGSYGNLNSNFSRFLYVVKLNLFSQGRKLRLCTQKQDYRLCAFMMLEIFSCSHIFV